MTEPVFKGTAFITQAGTQSNTTVILVHGMGDHASRDWDKLIPELAKQYHVIAFDLPGFGRSSKGNQLYSPAQYSAFIRWIADQYARKPFILIGHSMGGALALKYASLYPEHVLRLVLVDAAGILHHVSLGKSWFMNGEQTEKQSPTLTKELDALIRSLLDNLSSDERAKKLEQSLNSPSWRQIALNGDPKKISGTALMLEDFGTAVNELRIPTLLIWGEDDTIAPLRTAYALAGRLTFARLAILPQTGHVPMLQHSEAFNRIVLDELSSHQIKTVENKIGKPLEANSEKAGSLLETSERTARYDGQKDFTLKGRYKSIELNRCTGVKLIDIIAEQIVVNGSAVVIENSAIKGGKIGLKAVKSEIIASNIRIDAEIPIQASHSRLDFAGACLIGKKAAATTDSRTFFVFSISSAQSAHYTGSLHGVYRITKENPL